MGKTARPSETARSGNMLRFGPFELDTRAGELCKGSVKIRLQDQPLQILCMLLERPGEVVLRDEIRERLWGSDTLVEFDHGINTAVKRLRDALSDSADTPRYIETLPRRGYRFIAQVSVSPKSVMAPQRPLPDAGALSAIAPRTDRGVEFIITALLAAWGALSLAGSRGVPPAPRVLPVTSFPGTESHPAFSPDGTQLAFAWSGQSQDNIDIYIKTIGEAAVLRLTNDPAFDGYPAWSPDGKHIAFSSTRAGGGVYVVSSVGGAERKVANLATNSRPVWSPDGKFLLVAKQHRDWEPDPGDGALFLIPIENDGEQRRILTPKLGNWYKDPALSPDGRQLAFYSCAGDTAGANCAIENIGLNGTVMPSGEPRRMTAPLLKGFGLAWTSDSSSVVFSTQLGNQLRLQRVALNRTHEVETLELAGAGASYPAIDPHSGRLVFSQRRVDYDIWRLVRGRLPSVFLASTRLDTSPQYSSDGLRVAFASGREQESNEIWTARADGTGLAQLTRMGTFCGSPRWSPDGRSLAFDLRKSSWDIWTVDSNGGSPRQLTHGPSDNVIPSWSHDGKSIYFASNRSGKFQIWRMATQGGAAEQLTRNGGFVAFESSDGRMLYYTLTDAGAEGLYAKRLPDGEEELAVKDRIGERGFAVFADGVYYLHPRGDRRAPYDSMIAPFQNSDEAYDIRFYDFATRTTRSVADIEGAVHLGLAVSTDRTSFLFSKVIDSGSELMMIENFR